MKLARFVVLGLLVLLPAVSGSIMLKVEHKFKGKNKSLNAFRAHDARRHGRMLEAVDFPLGGTGNLTGAGLYYTKIRLGNPSKDYYVQVDTGSDLMWVNCAGCKKCPSKSDLGVKLTPFDPKSSTTLKLVNCDSVQCSMMYPDALVDCKAYTPCIYQVTYEDQDSTTGYIVQDSFHYDKVSGNLQTTSGNASVVFGCGAIQHAQLSTSLDGLIGFGQAKSSLLSQLAAARKIKKVFSHCLDSVNGGGIFAIGEIAKPTLKTTPLVPQRGGYTVAMKSLEVAGSVMRFASHKNALIDSGTTMAYVPKEIYQWLTIAITTQQPTLNFHTEDTYLCFQYSDDVDEGFPRVKLHFENSLMMLIYPHDYLFQSSAEDVWCIGWQSTDSLFKDFNDTVILGDMVLSNKLVVYDLEEQAIGWTDYNCSSSIKVKDSASGVVYSVGAHDISSAYLSTPYISITVILTVHTILFKINKH